MQHVVDFVLELDKLKGVTRKVKPLGLDRYENSAEHSWQLMLFAIGLAPYAATSIDIQRVVMMLLVHDIGEIDTGDTMFFVESGLAERKSAELAAVTRILGGLPSAQGAPLVEYWNEFEAGETAEARFAHAVDRAMPVVLNLHNNGQSWRENGISYERVVDRVGPPIRSGCPALWTYLEQRLAQKKHEGWFGMDTS